MQDVYLKLLKKLILQYGRYPPDPKSTQLVGTQDTWCIYFSGLRLRPIFTNHRLAVAPTTNENL